MVSSCTAAHVQTPVIPTDGVHITGAISAIYPITNGGTCPVMDNGTRRDLAISANVGAGEAYIGAVVANFTELRTYTDVRWPPDGHSSLYAAFGDRVWRAESGLISVKSFGDGQASGTLWASDLHEVNGSTTVNAAGSWTCRLLFAEPAPPPSPSPSPIGHPSPSPSPVGSPLPRQVLPPATVLPLIDLCSSPVQVFQDGNAGPLFCSSGALNVLAWRFFAQLNPLVMSLGPSATLADVKGALCAGAGGGNITLPEEDSAYSLAAAYNDWVHGVAHGFDDSAFLIGGGCL